MSLDNIYAVEHMFANLAEQFLGINHTDGIIKHSTTVPFGNISRNAVLFRGSMTIQLPFDHPIVVKNYEENEKRTRYFEVIVTEWHNVFVNWNVKEVKLSSASSDPSEFTNTGNHDSCWRSMDFTKMHQNFFEMCKDINEVVQGRGFDSVAPAKMDTRIDFGSFIGECPILFCQVEAKKKNNDTYFMDLNSIKLKKLTATFED